MSSMFAGMHWKSGPLSFAVIHPASTDYELKRTTNSMSCVVLIAAGTTRLLLTGDVPRADEAAILARDPMLRADWLAVPHHGSRSSSGAPLLETLGAASAVAQAGYRNRFGHPDAEVVARYRANNVRFFRTDYARRDSMALRSRRGEHRKHCGRITRDQCTVLAQPSGQRCISLLRQ